jgi:hypothetical protein
VSQHRAVTAPLVALGVGVFFALAAPALALAEEQDAPAPPSSSVSEASRQGQFLPLTLPADVGPARVLAAAYGGYDSAARGGRFVAFADARLYGPLALRLGAQSTGAGERIAPSAAARVQFLSQAKLGLDAAFSLAYNAEGFTEFEGEIEAVLALGKTFGNWRVLSNLAYGQDPEGRERDGEFRLAALRAFGTRYNLGLDGRCRIDLGSDESELRDHDESALDLDVGPVLNVVLGPVVLGAHAGFSAVQPEDRDTRLGVVALAGLGSGL